MSRPLAALKQKQTNHETQFQVEVEAMEAKTDSLSESLEQITIRPRKSDIAVDSLGLAWVPYWKDASGSLARAWG